MGLYVWIALGSLVGLVARLLTAKRIQTHWLEPVLMGIAGGAVGGYAGAQFWSTEPGLDNLGAFATFAAAAGGAIMNCIFLAKRSREARAQSSAPEPVAFKSTTRAVPLTRALAPTQASVQSIGPTQATVLKAPAAATASTHPVPLATSGKNAA